MERKNDAEKLMDYVRLIAGFMRPELKDLIKKIIEILPEEMQKEWIGRIIGVTAQLVEKRNIFGMQVFISDMIEIIADEISDRAETTKYEIKERNGIKNIANIVALQLVEQANELTRDIIKRLNEGENPENKRHNIEVVKSLLAATSQITKSADREIQKIVVQQLTEIAQELMKDMMKTIATIENLEKEREKKISEANVIASTAFLKALAELIKSVHQEIEVKEGKKIDWEKVFNRIEQVLKEKIKEETPTSYQKKAAETEEQK